MAYPQRKLILLFPPIPMPAWLFVTLYGVLELYLGITQTRQGVAHFAHLGGMATGFVLIRYWQRAQQAALRDEPRSSAKANRRIVAKERREMIRQAVATRH